jgi:hypothetical protein
MVSSAAGLALVIVTGSEMVRYGLIYRAPATHSEGGPSVSDVIVEPQASVVIEMELDDAIGIEIVRIVGPFTTEHQAWDWIRTQNGGPGQFEVRGLADSIGDLGQGCPTTGVAADKHRELASRAVNPSAVTTAHLRGLLPSVTPQQRHNQSAE